MVSEFGHNHPRKNASKIFLRRELVMGQRLATRAEMMVWIRRHKAWVAASSAVALALQSLATVGYVNWHTVRWSVHPKHATAWLAFRTIATILALVAAGV